MPSPCPTILITNNSYNFNRGFNNDNAGVFSVTWKLSFTASMDLRDKLLYLLFNYLVLYLILQ